MSRPEHLLLPRKFYTAMLEHAQAELPNECCGLLAGVHDGAALSVQALHQLINEANSPTEYRAEKCLFEAHKKMRDSGHDIVAIYHSHPTSAPVPSKKDLARNFYGDSVVHFIIGLSGAAPEMRGWWLTEDAYEEAAWNLVD